jgi:hypothetical protein
MNSDSKNSMALPICVNPRPSAVEESLLTSAFSLANARACVRASRLAYESPTITTHRCHVTVIEAVASAASNAPSEASDKSDLSAPRSNAPRSDVHDVPLAIVAFRGTANLVDFITDAKCWRTAVASPTATPGPASCISHRASPAVHSGFWLALLEIFQPLSDYISRLAPRPLIVTGHSLGGALAQLFTYRWSHAPTLHAPDAPNDLFPIAATYTFGQPRCGNRAFADFYDAFHRASTFRCVNEEDVVPRIPGLLAGYRHAGREVFFPFESSSSSSSSSSSFWIDPPLWRKITSDIRGLYRASRRQPIAALGQLLLDHHISNYIERLQG